jgi:hypothetical protein
VRSALRPSSETGQDQSCRNQEEYYGDHDGGDDGAEIR